MDIVGCTVGLVFLVIVSSNIGLGINLPDKVII